MKLLEEIRVKLGFNDSQMSGFLGISRAGYHDLKRTRGSHYNKHHQRLEKCRKALKMSHKAFYEWVDKLTR